MTSLVGRSLPDPVRLLTRMALARDGLFRLPVWRRQRRLMQPSFQRDSVRLTAEVTAELWRRRLDGWSGTVDLLAKVGGLAAVVGVVRFHDQLNASGVGAAAEARCG